MHKLISTESHASQCRSGCVVPTKPKPLFSWLPSWLGFLLVLLPKCPFCLVAYTSSMAMCGASPLISHHTDWGAWAALSLGLIVTYSIYRNYRGQGTKRALKVALVGLALVALGAFLPNIFGFYYVGATLLLVAAFYNGSGFGIINRTAFYVLSKARRFRKI